MPSSRLATGARGARARTERPHPLTGDEIVMKMQNEISRENLQELSRLSAFCLVAPRSGAEIQQQFLFIQIAARGLIQFH